MTTTDAAFEPPVFCQYANGSCDQHIAGHAKSEAFFIYPSQPVHLASTVRECVRQLRKYSSDDLWVCWEDLAISGQIIFCEICKAIRTAKHIVANITTMNFNVLFELGYALGLGKPVLPIRDSSYERDKKLFDDIGVFDTLGYEDFKNSSDLLSLVRTKQIYASPIHARPAPNLQQPIYYVRSPIETDGSIRLFSCLKKCYFFRLRTFDVRETPRLSLHEAYKQVLSSLSVIAHLIDPQRTGANSHNARCAFVCGLALAAGKHVLMLQEGLNQQPIDYRDIIIPYEDPAAIAHHVESIVRATAETFQSFGSRDTTAPVQLLERIDIGDVAAENEIQSLKSYFVKTPQFQQALQGHARLVIGRKGTGKTAIFYGIRDQLRHYKGLILDLKPEGHQFTKLREMILVKISEGFQQHTLTAFWHYLLLMEVAHKLLDRERKTAWRDPSALKEFQAFEALCGKHLETEGDFSERLMALVDRLIARFPDRPSQEIRSPEITGAIYSDDINILSDMVAAHLAPVGRLWILFDNIDKGFPTHGLQKEDVLIVRCLLEATRRLQRSWERKGLECACTVFIRRDVFDHLIEDTPDRGKESYANLDWSDAELLKELLIRRFQYEVPELSGDFDQVWSRVFDPHVGGESSFRYIISRTFLRPRDVLNFVRKCIQVAVSRGHQRVEQDDIMSAEAEFSEDMLNEIRYEMRDIFPNLPDPVLAFLGLTGGRMSREDIDLILMDSKIAEDQLEKVTDLLLWFSFLGIAKDDDEHYSYDFLYNILKLKALVKNAKPSDKIYTVHPAFQKALQV